MEKVSNLKPINVAVIGAGLMGSQHAITVASSPHANLIGITSTDDKQARELAEKYEVEQFLSVSDALHDPNVEAVVIATPTDTHTDIALQAIEANVHALIEKPVTRNLEDAYQIRDHAKKAGVVIGVGHVARYFPEYRQIAERIKHGEIGNPAVATLGRRCQQPDWAPDHWHTSMLRSGGVAVDMLIHDIDLVRAWFGEPETVYARVVGSDKYNGLDFALATLTTTNGPICHLHGSWAEPEGFSQSVEVCGSQGMISYDSRNCDELQLLSHDQNAKATALPSKPPEPNDPFQMQLADFVNAIRGKVVMPGDISWAIESLKIALAMLESSDRKEVIHLHKEALV